MARRIVVLGWEGRTLELTPLDADVLVDARRLRVSFTLWGGPLADAIVLHPHKRLLGTTMENAREADFARAWDELLRLVPNARQDQIRGPVPVGPREEER